MNVTRQQRIDALLTKRAELDGLITRLKQRNSDVEKKTRSRVLRLLGQALLASIYNYEDGAESVRTLVLENLKPRDQKVVLDYVLALPQPAAREEKEEEENVAGA